MGFVELALTRQLTRLAEQGGLMIYGKGGPYGTRSKRRARCPHDREPGKHQPEGEPARTPPHLQRDGRAEGDIAVGVTGLLGHDHLATTEIYLNLSPEHVIKEFIDKW